MSQQTMDKKNEISIAIVGSGGAGVMTTGELLLSAAAASGLFAIMSKSYGPQIRGGESACFIRLGDTPFEKQADEIDLLLAFDFRNADRFAESLSFHEETWMICEKAVGHPPEGLFQVKNQLPVAFKGLAAHLPGGKGRANIVALGLLSYLLGIQPATVFTALAAHFENKGEAVVEQNRHSFQAGYEWAVRDCEKEPFWPARGALKSLPWCLTGNQAVVLGSLAAGCDFYAGYPITPATEIMEVLSHYLPERGGIMIQAEDELAAVNMAIGASFGGKKAMTATSGPGFSLMSEGLGLALMAEIPLVVVNVQRGGPSTGIPTKSEQSDLWSALGSSHGDNPRVVLAASSVRDCIDLTLDAFNIAETYQVPVVLLTDQFLGSRVEVIKPFALGTKKIQTRQLPDIPDDTGYRRFEAPETGVAPMAVPGMVAGEYTADGLEHDVFGSPDASQAIHQIQSDRRLRKLAPLRREPGRIEVCGDPNASVAYIGWGSTRGVIREHVEGSEKAGNGVKGIIPHLLYPPQVELMRKVFEGVDVLYVVELSSMNQFLHYLRSFYVLPPEVISISRAGGTPFRRSELLRAEQTSRPLQETLSPQR